MTSPLQRLFEPLVPHFARGGWLLTEPPDEVLAMIKHPSPGVEHTLFVNPPWRSGDAAPLLACSVNVHCPALEACINDALQRDPAEAGRQSLRLMLGRLAPPAHLVQGLGYAIDFAAPDAASATALLRADFEQFLEPVRRRLRTMDRLRDGPLPPATVDPWIWHLRRAAWLHLHADACTSRRFLTWLQAQADRWLDEAAAPQAGDGARVPRLARPRRRVIPLRPLR